MYVGAPPWTPLGNNGKGHWRGRFISVAERCLLAWTRGETRWPGPSCLPPPAPLNSGLTYLSFGSHSIYLLPTGPQYGHLKYEFLATLQLGRLFPEVSLGLLPLPQHVRPRPPPPPLDPQPPLTLPLLSDCLWPCDSAFSF